MRELAVDLSLVGRRALDDKVAVVTGGGRGIGRAIALRLAGDGALVAVNFVSNAAAAEAVVTDITAGGGDAFTVQADVSSHDGIRALFDTVDGELESRRREPGFDILVNNAGTGRAGSPSETSEADFDAVFAANVKGPFFVTQASIPRLRDGGRVVLISSGRSKRPLVSTAAYCMAKAAVDTLAVMLAAELGPRGITVNALAPGWTVTELSSQFLGDPHNQRAVSEMTALRRLGQAEDVAAVAAFLASDEAAWVTGQYIEASGGFDLVATR